MSAQFLQVAKYAKPQTCLGCDLAQAGAGFTVPRAAPVGTPLIITDCVSHHDIRIGSPLQAEGEAGAALQRAMRLGGLSTEQFAYGSLVACKPPTALRETPYEFTAPDFCAGRHLLPYIETYKPRCIVALGPIVARALTGMSGEKLTIDMIRGYALPGIGVAAGIPVIPTTHPNYIVAGMSHEMALLIRDLEKAAKLDGLPEDPEISQYVLRVHGTRAQAGSAPLFSLEFFLSVLQRDPKNILVYDFEFVPATTIAGKKRQPFTTDAHITQVNFTVICSDGNLLTMVADWNQETKNIAIAILQTPHIKVSYNGYLIDERVALYNGFEIRGREHHDAMWMVHFLFPDLPARRTDDELEFLAGDDGAIMALQIAASLFNFPAPWKHLTGKDAHFYGARDTHATAVVFLGASQEMARRGSWGTYDYFVRQYWERVWKQAPGYPMSRRHLGEMQDLIRGQINAANSQIQTLIPPDLKPYKERSPRTPEQLESLKAEHGENLFSRQQFSEQKCSCARYSIGDPAAGCEDCHGTGSVSGKVVKCKTCAKHRMVKPHADQTRWSCDYCKWVDDRPADWGTEQPKPKAIVSFFKTRHDDDIRSGRYVCPTCKGTQLQDSTKACHCTERMSFNPECIRCHGAGVIKGMVDKWCVRSSFNPNSHDQIKRYVQSQNHAIPKAGLGRDGIAQLSRTHGNAVYNVLHQIKTLEAIAGATAPLTAAAGILSDDADDVERIKTSFMFMDAAGMVTSKDPDIITPPPAHKYPEIADAWNKCLATRPTANTSLYKVDFGPLELKCFALEAADPGLLQVLDDAENWLFEIAKFKRTVQGTGAVAAIYRAFMRGESAHTVYSRNRHLFTAPDMVAYLIGILEKHFPRCVEYKRMTANQAHKQGFLRSKFGYERQFFSVLRRSREGSVMESSTDYPNAVSFMARNHAACILALFAHTGSAANARIVAPTMSVYGPDGFLIEVQDGFTPTFPDLNIPVIMTPDGMPWTPTATLTQLT